MESAATTTARAAGVGLGARAWKWLRGQTLHIYAGVAVAYVLIPIGVIAVFSFAAAPPRDRLLYAINDGFTLEYWRTAFSVPSSTMPCSPRSSWRHWRRWPRPRSAP